MNKTAIIILTALCSLSAFAQNSPYKISENELPPSTIFTTYRSLQSAQNNISEKSENFTSLSGEWKIKLLDGRANIEQEYLAKESSLDGWQSIELPLSWQMNGDGEAIFSQKAYPFLKSAPKIQSSKIKVINSTTALLARNITVPFDYLDKVVYITIGASSARTTLYINGQKVGMSTDSRNPAQFNITKFVERGLNRIVLAVEQYCQASLIEDQSAWRLAGVNREIYMLAQPKIRVRDYLVRTSLDPTYTNGLLETALLLKSELLNPHQVTIYYDLYDRTGKIVNQANRNVMIGMRGEDTVRFTASILNVDRWSAETPSLYTLVYRVKREGRFTEYIARKVGFRNVEIKGKQVLINGVADEFRGVNLEEYNPKTGNVMSEVQTLDNLKKMKRAGINAIRTAGYPLPSFFYEMADSIGFYVVSTANINAQGMPQTTRKGGTLANNPLWRGVFVDRAIATYERSKNNPSIVAFALGEAAGNGYCMYQAYLAIKERDPLRAVIYDGAGTEWNTDIVCPLYPTIEELSKIKAEQPIIPSRVVFDARYWGLKNTQGAFIDRWQSPSIEAKSEVTFAELSDSYSLQKKSNGQIVSTSAEANIDKISQLWAPVLVEKTSKANTYKIENRMQRADLSYFSISYLSKTLLGKEQWTTLETVQCATGESVEVVIPGKPLQIKIGNIYEIKL